MFTEVTNWYSDRVFGNSTDYPWLNRGGKYSDKTELEYFQNYLVMVIILEVFKLR